LSVAVVLIPWLLFAQTPSAGLWIHPVAKDLPGQRMGPFVRLSDGAMLTVDGTEAFWS
jgi:hypothetical protein